MCRAKHNYSEEHLHKIRVQRFVFQVQSTDSWANLCFISVLCQDPSSAYAIKYIHIKDLQAKLPKEEEKEPPKKMNSMVASIIRLTINYISAKAFVCWRKFSLPGNAFKLGHSEAATALHKVPLYIFPQYAQNQNMKSETFYTFSYFREH